MNKSVKTLAFLPMLLLCACGAGLSGKYTAKESGITASLNFQSGGKAIYTVDGFVTQSTEVRYSVDGNTVKIEIGSALGAQNVLMTKGEGGCLVGWADFKFCPEK